MTGRTLLLTIVAMFAFAANSLLCRLALAPRLIDAASFTAIRMVAGAVSLGLIARLHASGQRSANRNRLAPLALFAYMICFSFAYLSLAASTGALILFGAVQITMFSIALQRGESFPAVSWAGLALAIAGLVYLVLPGVTAPDPLGAALMAVAGVSWGFYSLLGRGLDPLAATAWNFRAAVPLTIAASALFLHEFVVTPWGATYAVASGALASGCGYVIWYAALKGLSATRAATVQLSVPAIAAMGGVLLLSENVTLRLLIASLATLGGVAIVLAQRASKTRAS